MEKASEVPDAIRKAIEEAKKELNRSSSSWDNNTT